MIEMQPYMMPLSISIWMILASLLADTKRKNSISQMTTLHAFSSGGMMNSVGSVSRKAMNAVAGPPGLVTVLR